MITFDENNISTVKSQVAILGIVPNNRKSRVVEQNNQRNMAKNGKDGMDFTQRNIRTLN